MSHIVYPTRYVVVSGNIAEGFKFYGPFDDKVSASHWAIQNLKSDEYYGYSVQTISDVGGVQ